MLIEQNIQCPYCGQKYPSRIDVSEGSKEYTEDCGACSRSINLRIRVAADGSLSNIEISRYDA